MENTERQDSEVGLLKKPLKPHKDATKPVYLEP